MDAVLAVDDPQSRDDKSKIQRKYLHCILFVQMNSEAVTINTKRAVLVVNIRGYKVLLSCC